MKKVVAVVVLLVLVIYLSGSLFYKDRFPSRVYINDINVGGMTLEKADKELGKSDSWDKITINSDNEKFLEIKSSEIDYKYIDSPDLPEIFEDQNNWKWIVDVFKPTKYTTPVVSDYDKDKVKTMIDGIEELDKKLANAKVVYSEQENKFIIEPHSYEIKINKEELFELVKESIDKRAKKVNIEEFIEQPPIFADDKELIQAKEKANQYLDLKLKYDFGDREEIVDRSVLKDLIFVDEKEVEIDFEKVKEYVAGIARKYDTYGRARKFKTTSGKTIDTNGGSYGFVTQRTKTANELIDHIKAGEDKTIEPVYSFSSLIRESDDIGDSYVEIDLKEQMVYVYIQGKLKVKTPTVTGNTSKGFETPTGVYPLNYKETDATLVGENYASPVKYWMPFNGNVGLHDADWRTDFGGDIYETSGSHGCVNLPPNHAKTMFDLVYPGMPVIVH